MFTVNGYRVAITKGDTGEMVINLTGRNFVSTDRVTVTIANNSGTTKLLDREEYEITDGHVTVQFTNAMTREWAPGTYQWEARFYSNPTKDTNQKITGGSFVRTPIEAQEFRVLKALGE